MSTVIKKLPKHFNEEQKELLAIGVRNWEDINNLKEKEIFSLVQTGRSTHQNLKRLQGMSTFICELNLSQPEAALLMHAGVPSVDALAALNPEQLIKKTGRLERQLNIGRLPQVDLVKANSWIKLAKNRQMHN